ncbi:MAG: hypothetical protein ACO3YY_00410 [Phycisphaerales bacterium]
MAGRFELPSGARWSGSAVAAVVAGGIALVVALAALGTVIGTVFRSGAESVQPDLVEPLLVRHEELVDVSRRRFDGRSAFFLPKPPPRPKPPPPPVRDTPPAPPPPPPRDPGPPPPPASYGGPRPRSVMGDVVFFESTSPDRLRVGEESGGVAVIATTPPWKVRLGWSGGEYDVDLWGDRVEGVFSSNPFGSGGNSSSLSGGSSLNPNVPPASRRTDDGPGGPGFGLPRGGASGGGGAAQGGRGSGGSDSAGSSPGQVSDSAARSEGPNASALLAGGTAGDDESGFSPDNPAEVGSVEGREFVPISELPSALSPSDIDAMSRDEARAALSRVARARGRNIDPHSAERLREEFELLLQRLRRGD